eukprot:scaffold133335_cov76-Phaeocystis_antarctica.AAC.1
MGNRSFCGRYGRTCRGPWTQVRIKYILQEKNRTPRTYCLWLYLLLPRPAEAARAASPPERCLDGDPLLPALPGPPPPGAADPQATRPGSATPAAEEAASVATAEAASEAPRPPRRWPLCFASTAAAPAPGWGWGFGCRSGLVSPEPDSSPTSGPNEAPHPAT